MTRNRWGQRAGKERGEGEYGHRMKKTTSSTLTLATDVYTTTPSTTTTRQSHCLLNLDSTEKEGRIKQTGVGRGSRDIHEGGVLFSTPMLHDSSSDSKRSSHSGPDCFEESVLQKFLVLSLFLHQMPFASSFLFTI